MASALSELRSPS